MYTFEYLYKRQIVFRTTGYVNTKYVISFYQGKGRFVQRNQLCTKNCFICVTISMARILLYN